MRIAVVVCAYPPYRGGIGNAAARQAAALRDAGHEVVIMCPATDGASGVGRHEGLEVRRLAPYLRQRVSAFVPAIGAQMRGFDALYLHYPFFGGAEAAALAARWHGIPMVAYFHMDVRAEGLRGAVIAAYERTLAPLILRQARTVFVSSLDYASHASIGRLGLGTLRELPFSIDTDDFCPGPADPGLMQSLGVAADKPMVLFVGGMDAGHSFKGVPVLLEAMSGLAADEAQLVLVGDGELRPGFEQQARALCRVPVRFVGGAGDTTLKALYRAACVTVLPSTSSEEAFGIVLIESMASGTPVIASDLPGVRTVFDHETGVWVPVGDARSLREAIRAFTGLPEKSLAMRDAARRRAVQHYSRPREFEALCAAFESVRSTL